MYYNVCVFCNNKFSILFNEGKQIKLRAIQYYTIFERGKNLIYYHTQQLLRFESIYWQTVFWMDLCMKLDQQLVKNFIDVFILKSMYWGIDFRMNKKWTNINKDFKNANMHGYRFLNGVWNGYVNYLLFGWRGEKVWNTLKSYILYFVTNSLLFFINFIYKAIIAIRN